jgi:hypothetical protein
MSAELEVAYDGGGSSFYEFRGLVIGSDKIMD